MAVLSILAACERADEPTSEPVGDPIVVASAPAKTTELPPAPPATEPVRPNMGVPVAPINPRELPPPIPRKVAAKTWYSTLSKDQKRDVREICSIKHDNPCAGLLPVRMRDDGGPYRDPYLALLEKFEETEHGKVMRWCRANVGYGVCDTPLVVAWQDEPIELAQSTGAFTFHPGVPAATDWPTASTPWLAIDRDGDGAITSGAELFGDSTVLASGATAAHGFAALAELDANRDGVVDRRDPMFSTLLLWTDRDGDRKSRASELAPAASTVVSIPVAFEVDARCDGRGNCEGPRARLTWRDGSGALRTGAIVDLYLRSR